MRIDVDAGLMVTKIAEELTEAKKEAVSAVNRMAGEVRTRFVTDIPAQQLIYLKKEEEARKFLAADPEPTDLSAYPMIASEIGITGETAYQVAVVWSFMAEQWATISTGIEALRLRSIGEIEQAASLDVVAGIASQAISALDGVRP